MTLPTVPGPFSFLAELGRAGGAAFEQAEKDRQQKLKEARDQLNQMIDLRQAGLMAPEAFGTPDALKLYTTLGIMPVSDKPTPEEQTRTLRGQYLESLNKPDQQINIPIGSLGIGGVDQTVRLPQTARFTDEQRRVIGVPTADQLAVERAQGAEAAAKIPEVGTTTTAGQFQTQDEQFNDIADRVVQELYDTNHALPSTQQAFDAAQSDERYRKFGPKKITDKYFGAAIERQRRRLEDEKARLAAASARMAGAENNQFAQVARIYQRQIDQLNTQARFLADQYQVTPTMQTQYTLYQSLKKANPKAKVAPFIEEQARKYEAYRKALANIQSQMRFYSQELNKVTGPALGMSQPFDRAPDLEQKQRDWDDLARQYGEERTTQEIGPRPQ